MEIYYVYTITLQGIVKYVGITKDLNRRKYEHFQRKTCIIPFNVDLSLIELQPIKICSNKEEALREEEYYIEYYSTLKRDGGWNSNRSGLLCKEKFTKEDWNTIKEKRKNYIEANRDKINEKRRTKRRNFKHNIQYFYL